MPRFSKMSHRCNSRGIPNFYAQHNQDEQTQSTSGHGRVYSLHKIQRPPGLKGKEIGLFYRDRKIREKIGENPSKMFYYLSFHIPFNIELMIEIILNNSKKKSSYSPLFYENFKLGHDKKYLQFRDIQFERKFLNIIHGDIQQNLARTMNVTSKLQRNSDIDRMLQNEYRGKHNQDAYNNMLKFRLKLPAYKKKSEILQLIEDNQVVVISGETGCGKTTQVAQYILDDELEAGNGSITRIVCTQPRRISAISVAERVAMERAESLGKSVGYQIRLEKTPLREQGSILFCTTGILLQIMEDDPALKSFSHVILDEIHERTTENDFIIALLKQIIPKRIDLKVLLISATLNAESFSTYYNKCPMIHIPGFTYTIQEFYLEDILSFVNHEFPNPAPMHCSKKRYEKFRHCKKIKEKLLQELLLEPYIRQLMVQKKCKERIIKNLQNPNSENLSLELIEKLIRYICNTKGPGAILVFLPDMIDISNLNKMMLQSKCYPSHKYVIYLLHSRMPTVDQKLIFKELPQDVRKIIIATSIAETSVTIEDVVYVIDCGKTIFEKFFDVNRNIQKSLKSEWISLVNAKQRCGRAGRIKSGECYHTYTKAREMTFDQYPLPEMLKTCLEEVILQIKILQLGKAKEFLSTVMDPPDPRAINLSLELLETLNVLDEHENLTPLGYYLAHLRLDPQTDYNEK